MFVHGGVRGVGLAVFVGSGSDEAHHPMAPSPCHVSSNPVQDCSLVMPAFGVAFDQSVPRHWIVRVHKPRGVGKADPYLHEMPAV